MWKCEGHPLETAEGGVLETIEASQGIVVVASMKLGSWGAQELARGGLPCGCR